MMNWHCVLGHNAFETEQALHEQNRISTERQNFAASNQYDLT